MDNKANKEYKKDYLFLIKFIFIFVMTFLVIPYFILVKKMFFPLWVPNIVIVIGFLFALFLDILEKKGAKGTSFYEIIFYIGIFTIPIFFWTSVGCLLNEPH